MSAAFSPFFSEISEIEQLRLRNCNLNNWDISSWELKTRKLVILDLWLNPLNDAGVVSLASKITAVTSLQHLSLAKTGMTDVGARAILSALGGSEATAEEISMFEKSKKTKTPSSDVFRQTGTVTLRFRAPQLLTLSLAFNEIKETVTITKREGYRATLIITGCPAGREIQENLPKLDDADFGWRIKY